MSWDILITKFSRAFETVEDIPDGERPLAIGSLGEVHKRVRDAFPDVDWTDPTWGVWMSPFGSIEFNLGKDDPALTMMLHVRADVEVAPMIVKLCTTNDWQGLDSSSGEFIEKSEKPTRGLENWLAYRNQIRSLAK